MFSKKIDKKSKYLYALLFGGLMYVFLSPIFLFNLNYRHQGHVLLVTTNTSFDTVVYSIHGKNLKSKIFSRDILLETEYNKILIPSRHVHEIINTEYDDIKGYDFNDEMEALEYYENKYCEYYHELKNGRFVIINESPYIDTIICNIQEYKTFK